MTATDLVDRLANHRTLGAAPREELEWLAARGTVRRLEVGGVLSAKGAPVEGLFVILSGRIAIFIDRGSGPHKLAEWRGGDVTGLLPYSRLVAAPGAVARPGALGGPRRAPRAHERPRPGVPRADVDPRPPDDRSGAGIHVERAARREDDLARAPLGGPRPRAEQSRVRDRAERGAPREPARGRRAGGARARRGGPDGRPVRRDRRRAQRVRRRARAGSPVADRARRARRSHLRLARRRVVSIRPRPKRSPKPP